MNKLEALAEKDLLSLDEITEFGKRLFILLDEGQSITPEKQARMIAEAVGGQVYTQVDGEDDRFYEKGFHLVNRTGVYAVVVPEALTDTVEVWIKENM